MISAANVTMRFGQKTLFENVSVKFNEGCRYGLIGANGAGKSTFMKILTGELAPTFGEIAVDQDKQIGYLKQDHYEFDEPTNHLDLESIEALNYALTLYKNTILFVSHDREFISSFATRIIEIDNGRITDFPGTLAEFEDMKKARARKR